APAPLTLQDESGGNFGWAGEVSDTGAWLTLSPSSGVSIPVTVAVSANLTGLAMGSYQGTITFTSTFTGTRNSPRQVPVSLYLGPLNRQYLPWITQGQAGW
ncbi:MAG: BACON domain-containing carbohydrate-binding protein, partial [Dehalococcoidia bacterium]|nr:BACON domain-containing carbohydrate-binding protein [Dehalococcoidia bacterium]